MKLLQAFVGWAILLTIVLTSCKPSGSNTSSIDFSTIDTTQIVSFVNPLDTTGDGLPIFYNMYLSVEVSTLFKNANVVFAEDILNKTEKITDYITSDQKALNLGVYAVDLTYARSFEQFEIAGFYLKAMQELALQLGIPSEYFNTVASRLEDNINDKDSIIKIANEVYSKTEEFLQGNERYATSALVILGGWIEAIYIAGKVAVESESVEIIERYADQKHSLANVLILLEQCKSDEVVRSYLEEMKELKLEFDKLEVTFSANDNPESENFEKKLGNYLDQIKLIQEKVFALRSKIVT